MTSQPTPSGHAPVVTPVPLNARQPAGKTRLSEPHRWVDFTDYRRHAVPSELAFAVGDGLETFCGVVAVVCVRKVHHQAMWRTCQDCSDVALRLLAERSASAGAP